MAKDTASIFAKKLQREIDSTTAHHGGFYDTFNFVRRGNNLCHSITVGLIASVVSNWRGVALVGIDVRFNRGTNRKFQPDVVGFDQDLQPIICVDFESPNSSDGRIPMKDVCAYVAWLDPSGKSVPYIVVTSLPNRRVSKQDWELRWTSRGQCNWDHRQNWAKLSASPLSYWSRVWAKTLRKYRVPAHSSIGFINIDGRIVSPLLLD